MNTTCGHMAHDDGFVSCDVGRKFPFECRCCAAWGKDADPTVERDRIWHVRVVGPAQAQADFNMTLEPGSGGSA